MSHARYGLPNHWPTGRELSPAGLALTFIDGSRTLDAAERYMMSSWILESGGNAPTLP
jgi:hypothetical protein